MGINIKVNIGFIPAGIKLFKDQKYSKILINTLGSILQDFAY